MEVFKLRDYSSDDRVTNKTDLLLFYSTSPWGVAGRESSEAEEAKWPAALSACEHRSPSLSPGSWVELRDSVPFWGPTALAAAV